ncbi:hypothetical protein [Parvicella tangerina]|uniref:Uncharacterized protein n=1 Tax=Parvicella tangerina TaxID=2829795 RepID=A0A916NIW9_9FLAO|nr:hypothetical protein [Parvicella tangerina]CAG5085918.1 hypothetical protein CRYO30217_02932 [Parvicella tangerina]
MKKRSIIRIVLANFLFIYTATALAQTSTERPHLVKPAKAEVEKINEAAPADEVKKENAQPSDEKKTVLQLTTGEKPDGASGTYIPKEEIKPFTPVSASGYTDENYQKNKEKSKAVAEQLNKPAGQQSKLTKPTLEEYIQLRDSYPANSNEYFLIQAKIDNLKEQEEK